MIVTMNILDLYIWNEYDNIMLSDVCGLETPSIVKFKGHTVKQKIRK